MPIKLEKQLEDMITAMQHWSALLVAYGKSDSAGLLNMARLELQLVLNNISDEEFKALREFVETSEADERDLPAAPASSIAPLGKVTPNGVMQIAIAQSGQARKH